MLETAPSTTDIQANLDALGPSPRDAGTVVLIVSRPTTGARAVLDRAEIDVDQGLVGDNWRARGSRAMPDGSAHPDCQITLMNSRVIEAIDADRARWPLAGDQLFVDFELGPDNLPVGQWLALGSAILEVTETPHTGCEQFTDRFGHGAIRFVNSPEGRQQRRRGINARVVRSGTVRTGDTVTKVDRDGG